MNYIYLITFFVTLLVIILILKKKGDSRTVPELKDDVYQSMPFEQLKQYTEQRIDYIKKNSKDFAYYNKDKFNFLAQALRNAKNLDEYTYSLLELPNSEVGYYPILPLKGNPDDYMFYQFGQGMIGWYWVYGTYLDPVSKAAASYFVYITRVDMMSPALRDELKLPLGSTTYYTINANASVGGKLNFSKKITLPGTYTVKNKQFTLDLKSNDITLTMTGDASFCNLECSFVNENDTNSKTTSFSAQMNTTRPGFWNGPKGCAPCSGGSGTLYFSKTNYDVSASININNSSYKFTKGSGWIDRQWQNTRSSNPVLNMLSNIVSTFNPKSLSFLDSIYFWIPINLGPNKQYMTAFFSKDKLTRGSVLQGFVLKYDENNNTTFNKDNAYASKVVILDGVDLMDTFWPTKFHINIDNGYIVDSSPFGLALGPENQFGTYHINGSAVVYDQNMKVIGTGFVEGNKIQDKKFRDVNTLKAIGAPSDEIAVKILENNKLSFKQTYPSFLIVFILVILIIILPILIYKTFA